MMVPVLVDARSKGSIVRSPVQLAERIPGHLIRQNGKPDEETTTNDEVVWCVQFEEKWFARLQSAEPGSSTRFPEVDLFRFDGLQIFEPVAVGYANVEFHFRVKDTNGLRAANLIRILPIRSYSRKSRS